MKKEERRELCELTVKELEEKRRTLSRSMYEARVGVRLGQLKDYSLIRKARLDIARIATIIRQKQIEQAQEKP